MSAAAQRAPREARCLSCGCTDSRACIGGCTWATVDRANGAGICTTCMQRRPAVGVWRPHTEVPDGPASAVIAVCLEADGTQAFVLPMLYEYSVKRRRWISAHDESVLDHEFFMWLDEGEIAPDELFTRSLS